MTAWHSLVQAVLVGSDKPWSLPAGTGSGADAVDRLLRDTYGLAAPDAPGQLLRVAGALALCRQAGWQAPTATLAPPALAPVETRHPAGADWSSLLADVLEHGPQRLQLQLLQAMARAGLHAPPRLIPALLRLGRSTALARPDLLPVLGERGRWLAAQNPEWAWACGVGESADSTTHWEHGSLEQRLAVLRAERVLAPDAARARLEADWSGLAAKDRAALQGVLVTGLSAGDEPFLTVQLKDRSSEVRSGAADLLAALPGSAYAARMAARLAPLCQLAVARAGLLQRIAGLAAPAVSFEAPLQKDADWKADQIDGDLPKYESLGERGWWLYQLARRGSLAWWTGHSGLDAAALVKLAASSDWAEALLRGWHHAVLTQPDPDWAEALLHSGKRRHAQPAPLLALLTPGRREAWQLAQLDEGQLPPAALDACLASVGASDCWGAALSLRLAQLLRQLLDRGALLNDYALRQQMPDLICALHPEALVDWPDPPRSDDETPGLSDSLNQLEQALSDRRRLLQLISTP